MTSSPAHILRRAALRAGGLLALGSTALAAAAPAPPPAIAARQDHYKKMGQAMKALNDQLKTDAPDKATMLAAARILSATARLQGNLFPAGSGPAPGVRTDALPNIWTERPAFDAAMSRMVAESAKLVIVATSGDPAAIRVQTKATGATCGGCHRQFRADS